MQHSWHLFLLPAQGSDDNILKTAAYWGSFSATIYCFPLFKFKNMNDKRHKSRWAFGLGLERQFWVKGPSWEAPELKAYPAPFCRYRTGGSYKARHSTSLRHAKQSRHSSLQTGNSCRAAQDASSHKATQERKKRERESLNDSKHEQCPCSRPVASSKKFNLR